MFPRMLALVTPGIDTDEILFVCNKMRSSRKSAHYLLLSVGAARATPTMLLEYVPFSAMTNIPDEVIDHGLFYVS